jgi:hypothetical protein
VTALNEILLIGGGLVLAGGLVGFALVRARDFVGRPAGAPVVQHEIGAA